MVPRYFNAVPNLVDNRYPSLEQVSIYDSSKIGAPAFDFQILGFPGCTAVLSTVLKPNIPGGGGGNGRYPLYLIIDNAILDQCS